MSTAVDPHPQLSSPPAFAYTPESLSYIATHVIFPPETPEINDYTPENARSLARAVCAATLAYTAHVHGTSEEVQWRCIAKMLNNLQASVLSEDLDVHCVISQLRDMQTGDILTYFIRRRNAAIVLTKGENDTLCEAFEVSPSEDDIRHADGRLMRSYPGSTAEIPNGVFDAVDFRSELAMFLSRTNSTDSSSTLPSLTHSQYMSSLLHHIYRAACLSDTLGSIGCAAEVISPIIKHIRDRVGYTGIYGSETNWRRSPLWVVIRVVVQIALKHNERASYKRFILFFICVLASDRNNANLSTHLLHSVPYQLLQRLRKLGPSTPDWLSEMVQNSSSCIRQLLDVKWTEMNTRPSPFHNPSKDDLVKDTALSFLSCREHIQNTLENPFPESVRTSFCPIHHRHGTLEDFLSSDGSFFDEAYNADPVIAFYDVEQSVEEGIDDWVAHVTGVDEACAQVEMLMDKYMSKMTDHDNMCGYPEGYSIELLTGLELYVALDKLAVKEIPMLAEYPPEIPIALLEGLLLSKSAALHRLSCVYQYLSARYFQSRPGWSVLSNEFTTDSFPVRYFDQRVRLQVCVEEDKVERDAVYSVEHADVCPGGPYDECGGCKQHQLVRQLVDGPDRSTAPGQALRLDEKVVAFEQQCPPCFRIWRSAAARILDKFCFAFNSISDILRERGEGYTLVAPVQRSSLECEIHCAYLYPNYSQSNWQIGYIVQHSTGPSIWRSSEEYSGERLSWRLEYRSEPDDLKRYTCHTSHTSNGALAALADCPTDFSLNEFIAFAHLRSGGSLQWLNVLQMLRTRSLNLRSRLVHFLLAHMAFQAGPLDLNTGTWIWCQELQDSSFCSALLDELDGLLVDVRAGSIDGVLMSTISMLIARVLASSPSGGISNKAIILLRRVRRKTFDWTQELSYNLTIAPTSKERKDMLLDMAATCASIFDVDAATHPELLRSAEDVDALLSCNFFVHALSYPSHSQGIDQDYLQLLLCRNRRLFFAIESTLKDVIRANPSDYGIDLAVGKIFAIYQPGPRRWEQFQHPSNAHWFTCETRPTSHRPLQTVHINLLDGTLRADGEALGGLPHQIWDSPELRQIFSGQGFFVIPSDLPGMDFTTFSVTSDHKVHFSWRGDNLVVRVQSSQTKEILELIPSSKLWEDLPPVLVHGHFHWLNISRKTIEIRPLKQLWVESSANWIIDCSSDGYHMYKGRETLVDVRSPTWAMISKCFECLTIVMREMYDPFKEPDLFKKHQDKNLLVTTSPLDSSESSPSLSVTLPRHCLSFFVNKVGELESRDFKAMVYDEDQSVGTLIGLQNMLVLRPNKQVTGTIIPDLIHRRVLIPSGHPTVHNDCQVRIQVVDTIPHKDVPSYYAYHVDTELGCLVGDSTMKSMSFLAYLHAKTNWHQPDPLTSKTGAQAELCLSQSGVCRSIKEIESGYYWRRKIFPPERVSTQVKHTTGPAGPSLPPNPIEPTSLKRHEPNDFPTLPPPTSSLLHTFSTGSHMRVTLDQLISNRSAPQLSNRCTLPRNSHPMSTSGAPALNQLFSSLRTCSTFQQAYHAHLVASAQYARTESLVTRSVAGDNRICVLMEHYMKCRNSYIRALGMLQKSLGPTADPYEQELYRFHQWPPITADVLLRYLAPVCTVPIRPQWKTCLTTLALLLLDLQRARRLLRFALDGLEGEFARELENEGCEGWSAEDYPDWLLVQIQGNFLIRRTQAETAIELMSPKSGRNTVLQVNMGEGKSSVIIPIAAAALADGKRLVRVIVPKSLTAQMFDLLVARLGGLACRPIYHLPFSRSPQNPHFSLRIDDIHYLMSKCMDERGIVLIQPEHVASLRLMGVEEQIRGSRNMTILATKHSGSFYRHFMMAPSLLLRWRNSFVGSMFRSLSASSNREGITRVIRHYALSDFESDSDFVLSADSDSEISADEDTSARSAFKWQRLQQWLHSYTRDILDESDEILHARFQLIYTHGLEQHMDGYPIRWTVTQYVLRLVKRNVCSLAQYAPGTIMYESGLPGSFPHIRILQPSVVGPRLMSLITENVMAGELPIFNFRDTDPALQDAIRSFISHRDILQIPETAKRVEAYARDSDQCHLWGGLLLLRGLLTSDILLFALAERRWRVDYGLVAQPESKYRSRSDPTPTMLAVPYRAKDTPAPGTQFGHPDLTIILTCLSYYYAGLTEEQLRVAFEILQDEDDPSVEYAAWLKEYDHATVTDFLQELKLNDINLRSSEQWNNVILPFFARNQAAIDFYLSRVVFPKEAKEFPWKLSASNWDLAEKREHLITGFSGTNDGRWLLPMSIAQRDLDHQKGANAKVLAHLLQPENEFYMVTHGDDKHWSTRAFLKLVTEQQPEIRVLLDVGSQILDLSNCEVASAWLEISGETAGAVYFDEKDQLVVLAQNGTTMTLSSAFSQQLERCVIYLDHAHTRGTDLKLPIGSRAAVTLGPKVTKDALVQGCMRMRKLGRGHSVMFFAPPEVDRSIRGAVGKPNSNELVTIVDVLCWTIYETWAEIQQRAPYWAQRGMNHKSRYQAWSQFAGGKITKDELADAWLQPELKSLTDLYAPSQTKNISDGLLTLDPEIRQRCKDLGVVALPNAQMDEEQEREVHREREREREVELPPRAEPAEHSLYLDVISFVRTGDLPPLHRGSAFIPVFTTLERSTAVTHDADVWSPRILATLDFCKTIEPESTEGTIDQYLRPVQWILSRTKGREQVLVLLSPFEVDYLMPDIRVSKCVHLHLYAPRMAERMKPSDDLRLYTIPPLPSDWTPPWDLIDQLNVFAGQLYLRDYQSYIRLCRFLDVPTEESPSGTTIRRNLFNIPGSFEEMEITFSGSPLPFVMALLAIRTRGRPFEHTHMGRILQGQVLTEKDFERPVTV